MAKTAKPTNMICQVCGLSKKLSEFYVSASVFHAGTGRVPYCKDCLKKMSTDSKSRLIVSQFKKVLEEVDKPYIHDVMQSSFDESQSVKDGKGDVIGTYFKNINSLPQYKTLKWADSVFKSDRGALDIDNSFEDHFNVTDEMIDRWGKYEPYEYHKLEKFYWEMRDKNDIETPQEETYLKKLALISMKMDQELEGGNYGGAKQLGDLFSKYMGDSQFRAIDKTDADKTGGIRTFSQIYAEVEKDDFIPPWEHYRKIKGLKQDIVDKTIMYICNFTLRLNKVEQMTTPPIDTPKIDDDVSGE